MDHGFNNVSTYGTLAVDETKDKSPENQVEHDFYELA